MVPEAAPAAAPPFCPNPACPHHFATAGWRWKRNGFHVRRCEPWRVQRFRCRHCGRSFSEQTFRTTYWLKAPGLLRPLFWRLLACSGFRQIAREFGCAPSTIAGLTARLGRHALLFHRRHGPAGAIVEPLVLDGFESFEFSQYHPTWFHLLVGAGSHFLYGFTDSELRRKGRMTARQRVRRAELEATLGRPDPKSIEREVAELFRLVAPRSQRLAVHSDDHPAYPRAFRRLPRLTIHHQVTPGTLRRTTANPLFPINLADLLIRHSGANHKRETIAFSKRRQSAAERLTVFQVWRNFIKPISERRGGATPAMRLGLRERPLTVPEVLTERLFVSRVRLPERLALYYWRRIHTRALPRERHHRCRYAA
jgi:transposase-like protein